MRKRKEQKKFFADLFEVIASIDNPKRIEAFLTSLLTPTEMGNLSKRLRIAQMLSSGLSFEKIRAHTGVGLATISKVNAWLKYASKGYDIALKELKKTQKKDMRFFIHRLHWAGNWLSSCRWHKLIRRFRALWPKSYWRSFWPFCC